ncbi:MAG: hypothetical protein VKJ64_22230, partial [Leptolyngbyaceae bacterium]|nr:hypothetical protein [Leptolyngbyaceae bacterium]
LQTLTDQWAYFLNHARELEQIPAPLRQVAAIEQAFTVANQANLTPEELDDLEHQEMFIQDQRGAIVKATNQALERGIQQGIERGIQQTQSDIAQRLLPILDDEAIRQVTGLAIATIQQLQQTQQDQQTG